MANSNLGLNSTDGTNSALEEKDDDLGVEYRVKTPSKSVISNRIGIHRETDEDDLHTDELAAKFEEYGNTPPRTRMKIKNRDWDRKQKSIETPPKKGMTRQARSRVQRRNTMDCAILNEMFIETGDKRAQTLLRESERDIKNSSIMSTVTTNYHTRSSVHEMQSNTLDKCPLQCLRNGIPTLVESCNRYMSVTSKPVGCRASAPPAAFNLNLKKSLINSAKINVRKDFHETFANLIKLGSVDRQEGKLSQEDYTWQTELKDLIWLELQAWQADRTIEQQDKFLFTARQGVAELLNQIINYKFRPRFRSELSVISSDSGISSDSANYSSSGSSTPNTSIGLCTGCLSLYCKYCSEQQVLALKEVEELLTRLETAEALYPSSQAMGAFHPIYKCESFVGRVKAMCLWYNITKQHRLKLKILGKILARLKSEKFQWPVETSVTESSSSSGLDNDDSANNSVDSKTFQPVKKLQPKVQFQMDSIPHESTSSNDSSSTEVSHCSELPVMGEYTQCINDINLFNVEPLANITYNNVNHSTALYRKYIENVLKSRGLARSLSFLHKLHNLVLYKAHISLEKPGIEDYDIVTESLDENVPCLEPDISKEQVDELRRYGLWSTEAKSLNLPSYVPSFVFLSVIPLEFIHEFLRMRLETRPFKPNPLSLEQLMKELREGLTLSLTHRERYQRHITTALNDREVELEKYLAILDQFDSTIKKVLELYLDYVDQLVLVAAPENHQKSALEKEWMFTKLVSPMIPGMHTLAANKFCLIIRNLLKSISDRLVSRSQELHDQIGESSTNCDTKKWQLLTICRETQALFTIERESSIKVLSFAKIFCRDVEQPDFHREHYEEYVDKENEKTLVCPSIKDAFKLLQKDILDVRNKLTKIVEHVQDSCCIKNMSDLDDQDKMAVLSRSREILHQGYKFGFEFNKDIIRLFEQKIMMDKDDDCDSNLSLGIIAFAKMWMQFVTERCERGRGVRPRYASQGLEFLILACDPQITVHLNDSQFDDLKIKMDCCISHVIGITSEPEKTKKKASPRTRKTSSPAPTRSRTPTRLPTSAGVVNNNQKFLHPQFSLREEINSASSSVDSTDFESSSKLNDFRLIVPTQSGNSTDCLALRQIRVRDAVNRLDMELETKLRERNLIGQPKTLNTCDKVHISARSVSFRWHRGIKIGQGRFGKVYTAVNNTNGELMAMKEIVIQPGETRAIKNVAEELKTLEGVSHKNLVRYYGIEIHREELLIFMELCSEGTLESIVELSGGLHEGLTRRFTAQLLSGVKELHKHGIVHRDIKPANIFLVDCGNSLKLGDFGSAVKIQAHTTIPGELQGYVGTQAYMAPEVFTKTNSDGHGRAADIWSVGCVVVEMASGKRPWSQFDSNFQIMFKVGMGESPEIPESLSQEGYEFVEICIKHDPKERQSASDLLNHNFCKVGLDEEFSRNKIEHQGRISFRKTKF